MVNVVCMKWGTKYGPEYVNILYSMVKRNLTRPFRFACLTDDRTGIDPNVECFGLPDIFVPESHDWSPWRKLGLLSPTLGDLQGPTLFLDLDLVIVDNIDCFFDKPGDFCIIENWTQKGRGIGNSSVFRFNVGAHSDVVDYYNRHMNGVLSRFDNEQMYISRQIGNLTYWDDEWCRSFKRHCLPGGIRNWFQTPRLPEGAKIIVFHGDPKPIDAAEGRWPGRLLKHVRPTPWVREHWR